MKTPGAAVGLIMVLAAFEGAQGMVIPKDVNGNAARGEDVIPPDSDTIVYRPPYYPPPYNTPPDQLAHINGNGRRASIIVRHDPDGSPVQNGPRAPLITHISPPPPNHLNRNNIETLDAADDHSLGTPIPSGPRKPLDVRSPEEMASVVARGQDGTPVQNGPRAPLFTHISPPPPNHLNQNNIGTRDAEV